MTKTLYLTFCILAIQTIASAQNLIWAKHVSGNASWDIQNSVLAPNGDLLSTGTFQGTFNFETQQTDDRFYINLDAPSGVYQVLINYSNGTATKHKVIIANR